MTWTWTYHVRKKLCVTLPVLIGLTPPPFYTYVALERDDHIAKFRFRYLGIVEVSK